jgi:hypothetical protein
VTPIYNCTCSRSHKTRNKNVTKILKEVSVLCKKECSHVHCYATVSDEDTRNRNGTGEILQGLQYRKKYLLACKHIISLIIKMCERTDNTTIYIYMLVLILINKTQVYIFQYHALIINTTCFNSIEPSFLFIY